MTSAIDPNGIIETFPEAGKDNNSEGFRNNFEATKLGFATAKAEITRLQQRTLLAADLSSANGTAVVNDLQGSTISNGLYKQFNGVVHTLVGISGRFDINLNDGPMQKVTIDGDATLTFINWPATGQYSSIRLMIIGFQPGEWDVTFDTEEGGTKWYNTNITPPLTLTLTTNNNFHLIEAFTYDGGDNVFINKLAEYSN